MNTRTVVLLSLFVILGGVYVWFVLLPSGGDLQMAIVQRPPRPLTFMFNRDVTLEEVKVSRLETGAEPTDEDDYERVVWHLTPDPESADEREARDHVAYGRGIKGMRLAEGLPRRPETLRRGETYTFEARTTDGDHLTRQFIPK